MASTKANLGRSLTRVPADLVTLLLNAIYDFIESMRSPNITRFKQPIVQGLPYTGYDH